MKPRLFGVVTACLVVAGSATASADDGEAERLFQEGRAAMLAGDFATACPKLAESQRRDPHTGTLLNLAACHEREGKVASAWVEYQKALTAARTEGQAEKARLAEQRIATLEPRVPWLKLVVPSGTPPDTKVTLDGAEIARAALGTEMPVDPGMHVVTGAGSEQRVDLREGERRSIVIAAEATTEPKPERVIVDPPAPKPADPVERGRWIIHFGTMFGFGWGRIDHPDPTGGGSGSSYEQIPSQGRTYPAESCAPHSTRCEYPSTSAFGSGLGVHLYAGYAFSDTVDAGLRLLGLLSSDFSAFAFGPSVTIRSSDRFAFGAFAVFGDATLQGRAYPTVDSGYRFLTRNQDEVRGDLAGGLGLGVTASFRLYKISDRSELTLDAMPFFLSGSGGNALVMPVGVGFRYQ